MTKKNPVKNSENTRFKPGVSGNPNGRPRKWVSQLTDIGYKKAEINDALMAMLAMSIEELGEVYTNPDATILEKTIARALTQDIKKGRTTTIDKLIERVHGKAAQEIKNHVTGMPNKMEITIVKTNGIDTSKNDS